MKIFSIMLVETVYSFSFSLVVFFFFFFSILISVNYQYDINTTSLDKTCVVSLLLICFF